MEIASDADQSKFDEEKVDETAASEVTPLLSAAILPTSSGRGLQEIQVAERSSANRKFMDELQITKILSDVLSL